MKNNNSFYQKDKTFLLNDYFIFLIYKIKKLKKCFILLIIKNLKCL